MKKYFIIGLIIVFANIEVFASLQPSKDSLKIKGTPELLVFSNFHQGVGGDTKESNFDIKRACFGYYFQVPKGFSSRIRIDVCPTLELGQNLNKVNIYLRAMYISYQKGKFLLNTGLVDNLQHRVQENFWGKRYVFKSFIDEYRFLPSIDLGFNGVYRFTDDFAVEFGWMSGSVRDFNVSYGKYYYSLGINYNPLKNLKTKLYSTYSFQNENLYTMGAFVGYNIIPRLGVGIEYNAKFSPGNIAQHGHSAVLNFDIILDKLNLFARYDRLDSYVKSGFVPTWLVLGDGYGAISGIDWKVTKNIRLSLNYQSWFPKQSTDISKSYVFFNVEFRI